MIRRFSSLAILAAASAAAVSCRPAAAEPPAAPPRLQRLADIVLQREYEILRALVPPRTTLASMLESHRVLAGDVAAVVSSIAERFDVRRLRAGQRYRVDRLHDGRLRAFEYEIDDDRRVIARRRDDAAPAFEVELAQIEKTIERVIVAGEISPETPTLIEALAKAGGRIELSLALAEIFAGEVDFNSDVHPGDRFRLVVDRGTRPDGTFGGYGPVLVAEYVNSDRALHAVRFTPPGGQADYYDADGRSLKRFFLKSPLRFEPRVTSSFSRARRHPILAYTRAHNGVDYAAPTGAAVGAVAGGVVTLAGWTGGGGRTVRMRHAGGYESEYLHLSSIAPGVRPGVRVNQGELIGRVGSSGLATGPHLHYGLKRDGVYVNPVLEHQRMPPGLPIAPEYLSVFDTERDRLLFALGDVREGSQGDQGDQGGR